MKISFFFGQLPMKISLKISIMYKNKKKECGKTEKENEQNFMQY